jgi:tripartite-type tricarboxylate transporter receptor subunit TctC
LESKEIIPIATVSEERFYPDASTLLEHDVDNPFVQWRGIWVAAGTDSATARAISDLLYKASRSDSFVAYMNASFLVDSFIPYPEFDAYVREFFNALDGITKELLGQ